MEKQKSFTTLFFKYKIKFYKTTPNFEVFLIREWAKISFSHVFGFHFACFLVFIKKNSLIPVCKKKHFQLVMSSRKFLDGKVLQHLNHIGASRDVPQSDFEKRATSLTTRSKREYHSVNRDLRYRFLIYGLSIFSYRISQSPSRLAQPKHAQGTISQCNRWF